MSSLTLEAGHVGSKTQEEKGDMKNGGLPLSEKGGFLTSQNGEIVHTVRSIDGGKRKNEKGFKDLTVKPIRILQAN